MQRLDLHGTVMTINARYTYPGDHILGAEPCHVLGTGYTNSCVIIWTRPGHDLNGPSTMKALCWAINAEFVWGRTYPGSNEPYVFFFGPTWALVVVSPASHVASALIEKHHQLERFMAGTS